METIVIEIRQAKARKMIRDMEASQLIAVRNRLGKADFSNLLQQLRQQHASVAASEIAKEVEVIRAKRHAQKS